MSTRRFVRSRRQLGTCILKLEQLERRVVPCVDGVEFSLVAPPQEISVLSDSFAAPKILEFGESTTGSDGGQVAFGDNANLVVPSYSSLPGAKATLYLDFNGHYESQWGSYSNIDTPAYDIDGNFSSFSAQELTNIYNIWQAVAEDYAPFNINVTTVLPSSFANGVALRVAIGGAGAWAGGTYGGVSYINSFTNTVANTAYVFTANLSNGYARYVADAVTHESGHAFGLEHQSKWNGATKVEEYSSGPGDDTAPLLGYSYAASRSLWWYGTTSTSNTYQNDLEVLASVANGFGYRTDDYGNSTVTASALSIDGAGVVSGSGLVGALSDQDYFVFNTGSGTITLTASALGTYGNLDVRLELYNATGTLVASADPSNSYSATITYTATGGTFYLVVSSHGVSTGATATNYGFNIGQYTLSGSIVGVSGSAPTAPSNFSAAAASSTQINLSWTDNASNETGFKIERLVNNVWTQVATVGANTTSWQDTNLSSNTTYTYRVRAYNGSGDSAYSNTASATTNQDSSKPADPSNLTGTAKTKPTRRIVLTWIDQSTNETSFKIERSSDGGLTWTQIGSTGANATSYTDTSVASSATYSYRVRASNFVGDSNSSNVVTVSTGGGKGRGPAFASSSSRTLVDFTSAAPATTASPAAKPPVSKTVRKGTSIAQDAVSKTASSAAASTLSAGGTAKTTVSGAKLTALKATSARLSALWTLPITLGLV